MASWAELVAFSKHFIREEVEESDNDRAITCRVMADLPVNCLDRPA